MLEEKECWKNEGLSQELYNLLDVWSIVIYNRPFLLGGLVMKRLVSSVVLFVSLLAYCGVEDLDFMEGLPDKESLKISFPSNSAYLIQDPDGLLKAEIKETAELYILTRKFTEVVNGAVYFLLSIAEDIARSPGGKRDGDVKVWGPYSRGGLDPMTYKFTLRRVDKERWSYILEAHGKESGEFRIIFSGEHIKGTKYRRGTGSLMVDFSVIKQMDPSKTEEGKVEAVYNTETAPYTLSVTFKDFIGNDGKGPINSVYNYKISDTNEGEFYYDAISDIDSQGRDENLKILSRWRADGAGRSDARVSGGDVKEQNIDELDISECWDTSYKRVYYESFVNSQSYKKQGDRSKCVYSDTRLP